MEQAQSKLSDDLNHPNRCWGSQQVVVYQSISLPVYLSTCVSEPLYLSPKRGSRILQSLMSGSYVRTIVEKADGLANHCGSTGIVT